MASSSSFAIVSSPILGLQSANLDVATVARPGFERGLARAKTAGAKIERLLADTEYGSLEYSARDCDGHLWSFGTYDPYAES